MIQTLTFDLTPNDLETLASKSLATLEKSLSEIGSKRSASSAIDLDLAIGEFSNSLGVAIFLKYVSPNPQVRKVADEIETQVQKVLVELFTRQDLFEAVKIAEAKLASKDSVERELINEYVFSFKKNGLGLPSSQKDLFVQKKKRLIELEAAFSKNLMAENTLLEFSKEDLQGLPQSFIDGLSVSDEGKYQISLSYPHVTPFMENVISSEARKRLSFHFNNRGGETNKSLLEEAIIIRHELAQLLGYPNHAALVLSRRMAGSPQAALDFLQELKNQLGPMGEQERAALRQFKERLLKNSSPLASYEWRFLHNQMLKSQFNFDPLKVQEYFPLEKVMSGMFEIYQTLLGVEFRKDPKAGVWHPSVQKFEVWHQNQLISHFYMDLFPREGKYGHAAAFTLISAFKNTQGAYQSPFSSIVANFSPPTQERPSLLTHSEVETLFHEFGHIMHQVLTRARFPSFSGTGVKTDFVEAPSQMFENWAWEPSVLEKISGHYLRPEEKLPQSLIERMLAAKNFNQALHYLRQIAFGLTDLELHSQASGDSTEIYSRWQREVLGIPVMEGTLPQASFGHLMGGYDAGYYGYLWAEVFAQDMFTRFEKEGILNSKTGNDYKKWILEPGGEKAPMDLIRGFLQREPSSEAFLKACVQRVKNNVVHSVIN